MNTPNRIALAVAALERSPIFSDLPCGAIESLAKSVRFEEYKTPTLLNTAGESVAHLRYVIVGHMVHRPVSSTGGFVESNSIGPAQWYSWAQVLGESISTQDIWSSADAAFLAFPSETVRAIALENPTIYPKVLQAVYKRFSAAQDFIWQRALGNDAKIIAQLLLLNCAMGDGQRNVEVSATQTALGKLAGWPRQKVSRILRGLAADNLIKLDYGIVTVLDRENLHVFVRQEEISSK